MAQATESAQSTEIIPFSFTMFLTGYTNLSTVGDPNFPNVTGEFVYDGATSVGLVAQQWQQGDKADKELSSLAVQDIQFDESLGSGRLLIDTVKKGLIGGGDPSISSFVQRASSALGDREFSFRPRSSGHRGSLRENEDEFVQRATAQRSLGLREMPEDEEWEEYSSAVDDTIAGNVTDDENGNRLSTTDQDYWDTMGRGGRAQNEMNRRGGNRNAGQGIRNELGGSDTGNDLAENPFRGDSGANQQRDVPFGLMPMPG